MFQNVYIIGGKLFTCEQLKAAPQLVQQRLQQQLQQRNDSAHQTDPAVFPVVFRGSLFPERSFVAKLPAEDDVSGKEVGGD